MADGGDAAHLHAVSEGFGHLQLSAVENDGAAGVELLGVVGADGYALVDLRDDAGFDVGDIAVEIGNGKQNRSAAVVIAGESDVDVGDFVEDGIQRGLDPIQSVDRAAIFIAHTSRCVENEQDIRYDVVGERAASDVYFGVVCVDGDGQTGCKADQRGECKANRASAFHTPMPARPT